MAVSFAIALLLAGTLLWLGWRLAAQDRQVAEQRMHEQRENAADLAVAALQRALSQVEERLATLAATQGPAAAERALALADGLGDDSVVLLVRDGAPIEYPAGRLAFSPVAPAPPEPAAVFIEADALEFQQRDLRHALMVLQGLADDPDVSTRAAALMRIARIQRKQERRDEALASYLELGRLGDVRVGDRPAALVARQARLGLFEQAGRTKDAEAEARGLRSALDAATYRLDRGAYEYFMQEAERHVRGPRNTRAEALSAAAERVAGLARDTDTGSRRTIVHEHGLALLAVWRHDAAVVLGRGWLETQWPAALMASLAEQGLALRLTDPEGRVVSGDASADTGSESVRLAATTALPWNVHARTVRPEVVLGPSETRQRLLLAALAIIGVLILGGGFVVARAVAREIEVSRLQSDFVSAVSHEFRTPLTSLCLLSEQLDSGSVHTEEARREYYGTLARESQRLRRLVEGLLNFGRMEAGAEKYEFEVHDPVELARDVAAEFQREVNLDGYRVEFQAGDRAPLIRGDRAALASALWNLLDNAVKYSPSGRTVWVGVGEDAGRAALRVRDEGLGIPKGEQSQVFAKFFRGEAARAQGIRGTGIGLATVRHIVERHGGEIRLESDAGAGATFTILLPGVQ
jgi:signal transduction histidine kinase